MKTLKEHMSDICKTCGQTPCNCTSIEESADEHYAESEKHKANAAKALETSDMEAHHYHMSMHHEARGQWHESKGRHELADREYEKAEEHHEKSISASKAPGKSLPSVKEETIDEALPGSLSSSDYMSGAVRHDLSKGSHPSHKKDTHVKTFHPSKEKEAHEFAKKHGYVVKKHELPSGNNISHEFQVHKESVAEGFSDIVKGVKRKVAGKADPKDVVKDRGVKARQAIDFAKKSPTGAAFDDEKKQIDRYKKVAKVVNKEGVAEGLSPGWMLKKDPELAKRIADKIKIAKERAKSHGDANYGKKEVKEETEQIDELSVGTLQNYRAKAQDKSAKQKAEGEKDTSTTKGLKAAGEKIKAKLRNEEVEQIDELTSDLLARYKEKAGAAAEAADKAKKYDLGHKRFKGILKATFKQFANDAKK